MTLLPFQQLLADAERGGYAVGYFESWNLESLQAVADAAERMRSPVILGFSGIYLPHPDRIVRDRLSHYAALGLDVARNLSAPCCLLFNESPHLGWVWESLDRGFNMVMFTDEALSFERQAELVAEVVRRAHAAGVAVEGETSSLAGINTNLSAAPDDLHMTDVASARRFVEQTGVDALAVNVGQAHLHGRAQVGLRFDRLAELRAALPAALALHGATSVRRADLARAVEGGIRKINVGSILKRRFFDAVYRACAAAGDDFNPYDVLGSGFDTDVLAAGRVAMQQEVETLMTLFGSAGRA